MALIDVVDDIAQRVDQIQGYLPTDINDYLKKRATEEFIKATGGARGNQTAQQIANGQYGGAPGVASASGSMASMNALSFGQVNIGGMSIPVIPLVLVGVAAFFILKKRRG